VAPGGTVRGSSSVEFTHLKSNVPHHFLDYVSSPPPPSLVPSPVPFRVLVESPCPGEPSERGELKLIDSRTAKLSRKTRLEQSTSKPLDVLDGSAYLRAVSNLTCVSRREH